MNITRLLSQTYVRMLKEDHGMEDAAADVHAAWMSRPANKKTDYNAAQHVPYKDLPEKEKQKDREHIIMAGRFFAENPKDKDESQSEHHERIANMIGTHIHDAWRSSRKVIGKNTDGTVRYEPRVKPDEKVGGSQDIANTPFHELTAGHKEENYLAGHAAVAAHVKHMSGINESHTAKEIASTPSKELRGLADTYSKKVSVVRQKAVDAKEAGNHEEAAKLHKQADAHQDEEMDIRDELRRRLGMK
jgi:hypothetical protein